MDPIQSLLTSSAGRGLTRRLGLVPPAALRRHAPGDPLLPGPALVAGPGDALLAKVAGSTLAAAGATVQTGGPAGAADGEPLGACVVDASAIDRAEDLVMLRDLLAGPLRRLAPGGRVLVLGLEPAAAPTTSARVARRALEGFTRSVAKELRGGATANLVLVEPDAAERISSTVAFLASGRSAFVDGQVIRVGNAVTRLADRPADPLRPLDGCVVAVTGAARGIGAAMVEVFARDGAVVIGVDVPAVASDLRAVTSAVGGEAVVVDVTAPEAAARIAAAATRRGLALHGVVHNAGITRDRRLVNLEPAAWQQVINVNLIAVQRITEDLLSSGALAAGGRVVTVSSVAGIAGNVGQTSYAASKAGVIGLVDALAPDLAGRGLTINAIAPGFIETEMTRRIPLLTREGGRRLSSLAQGGLPVDVAETAAWLLDPATAGVTGNVVRVCGQGFIGA